MSEQKPTLLTVGSVAFDSVETPTGAVDMALGGSATFASLAASYFAQPQVVAVVGPAGRRHQLGASSGLFILADWTGVGPIGVRNPEVFDSAAVTEERDRSSIRREDRLALERDVSKNACRDAPIDRERVQIAQEVEDDRSAVRGDV